MGSRFAELFGSTHPIQQAGMAGASGPDLAAAVSNAGGLGMLAMPMAPAEDLAVAIAETQELTAGPIGVNFIVPMLQPGAVEIAARAAVAVEFFWDDPDPSLVSQVHEHGARAGWQVGSVDEGVAAVEAGCDYVVLQGVEAGGHVYGTTPREELLARFLDRTRDGEVTVVVAGGLGDRASVDAALRAGADGVRIGTRFVAADEAPVHAAYVDALIASTGDDTVMTTAFEVGWPDAPHRVLRDCLDRALSLAETTDTVGILRVEGAEVPMPILTPMGPAENFSGHVDALAMYAGTSVDGVTRRQTAAEIVTELVG